MMAFIVMLWHLSGALRFHVAGHAVTVPGYMVTWFQPGYTRMAVIFPFLVAAPRYFSGAMQLGGLVQTSSAFGQVQGALSWFVNAYASLADWKATVDRLTSFRYASERATWAMQAQEGLEVRRGPRGIENHGVSLAAAATP